MQIVCSIVNQAFLNIYSQLAIAWENPVLCTKKEADKKAKKQNTDASMDTAPEVRWSIFSINVWNNSGWLEENLGLPVLILPVYHPTVGAGLQKSHLPVHALALTPQVAPPTAPEAVKLSSSIKRKAMPLERRRGSSYISTVWCQKTEMLPLHRIQQTKGKEAEEADNSSGPQCGGFHTLFK